LLQPGDDVLKPSDRVRLLGVTIAANLGFERRISNVYKTCFSLSVSRDVSSIAGH